MTSHQTSQPQTSNPGSSRDFILDVYNLVLAVFLFASPWLFAYVNRTAQIDLWASSILIGAASAAAIAAFSDWEEWLNPLIGIWLVLAPWILGFAHAHAMHASVAAGIIVAYLAGLRLWLEHYGHPAHDNGDREPSIRKTERRA